MGGRKASLVRNERPDRVGTHLFLCSTPSAITSSFIRLAIVMMWAVTFLGAPPCRSCSYKPLSDLEHVAVQSLEIGQAG